MDLAHLLPSDLAAALTAELAAHEGRTGNQVALLTLPSLEGESLEEFSHRVATTWQLGQRGTDNGVLVLVVPGDRKVRIEVGYGLEGVLTDAMAARIIRHEMVPRFRAGDYPGGIAAGLRAVLGVIEGVDRPLAAPPPDEAPAETLLLAALVGVLIGAVIATQARAVGGAVGGLLAFFMALSAGLLLAAVAATVGLLGALALAMAIQATRGRAGVPARRVRADPWAGGWSGGLGEMGDFGGGFSGGGGDFGGGGASGSW